jgi:hypothetical protein
MKSARASGSSGEMCRGCDETTNERTEMTKREFTESEIKNQDYDEIESRPWRHGRTATFVFELDGDHWRFVANVHHNEGLQIDGPTVTATKVHQVERTMMRWEPVP